MSTSHRHTYLSGSRYSKKDAHPHHAYCKKTKAWKDVTSSRPSFHPMQVAPPLDSSVATPGSPAHPAAALPGLINQAHAGSTWAAHTDIDDTVWGIRLDLYSSPSYLGIGFW